MSRLELKATRPLVAFDVENKRHREYYARFMLTNSWRDCPYRFELDEVAGELQAAIQRRLLQYYGAKEFKIEVDNR